MLFFFLPTGALGSCPLAFVLPCLFHIKLRYSEMSRLTLVKDCAIMTFGAVACVVSVVVSLQEMIHNLWSLKLACILRDYAVSNTLEYFEYFRIRSLWFDISTCWMVYFSIHKMLLKLTRFNELYVSLIGNSSLVDIHRTWVNLPNKDLL